MDDPDGSGTPEDADDEEAGWDVDPVTATAQLRQRGQFRFRPGLAGLKQQAQPGFDQFGHGAFASCRFLAQPRHHGVVDIERGLHMGNHIDDMAICQLVAGVADRGTVS